MMTRNFLAAVAVAIGTCGPALAQRSLFDQPVQNPSEAPPATAAPVRPITPAPPAPQPPQIETAPAASEAAPAEKPRRAAKPRKPRGPVPARALVISNGSPLAIVGLEVSQGDRTARLKRPIPPGKKGRIALPAFKTCEVGVVATFEGQPAGAASPVDICKEKSLNFRE